MSRLAVAVEPTPRFDISDARRFGDIAYIWPDSSGMPPIWTHDFIERSLQRLREMGFKPSRDYLIVSGSTAMIVMISTELVRICETVNLLYFDAKNSEYVHKQVTR